MTNSPLSPFIKQYLRYIAKVRDIPEKCLTEPIPSYIPERNEAMKFCKNLTKLEKISPDKYRATHGSYSTIGLLSDFIEEDMPTAEVGTVWTMENGIATLVPKYVPCICGKPPTVLNVSAYCTNVMCPVDHIFRKEEWNAPITQAKKALKL